MAAPSADQDAVERNTADWPELHTDENDPRLLSIVDCIDRLQEKARKSTYGLDPNTVSTRVLRELLRGYHNAEKFKDQVRDTCARAETAEAQLADAKAKLGEVLALYKISVTERARAEEEIEALKANAVQVEKAAEAVKLDNTNLISQNLAGAFITTIGEGSPDADKRAASVNIRFQGPSALARAYRVYDSMSALLSEAKEG